VESHHRRQSPKHESTSATSGPPLTVIARRRGDESCRSKSVEVFAFVRTDLGAHVDFDEARRFPAHELCLSKSESQAAFRRSAITRAPQSVKSSGGRRSRGINRQDAKVAKNLVVEPHDIVRHLRNRRTCSSVSNKKFSNKKFRFPWRPWRLGGLFSAMTSWPGYATAVSAIRAAAWQPRRR
jgi:hypothetical protein